MDNIENHMVVDDLWEPKQPKPCRMCHRRECIWEEIFNDE